VAGNENTQRRIPNHRDGTRDRHGLVSAAAHVRVGEPQVFDTLTVSCRGCGRAIPPGEVFTRHPTPDDRRRDLTSPFCQTCRPIGGLVPDAVDGVATDDLLAALRSRLENQARAESGTEV
jgi:hypothetical protein